MTSGELQITMDFETEINHKNKTILVSTHGVLMRKLFYDIQDSMVDALKLTGYKRLLIDHSDADLTQLSSSNLISIAEGSCRFNEFLSDKGKFALVTGSIGNHEVVLSWQVESLKSLNVERWVFLSLDEALVWVYE
jgi:hypothetical protein